MHATIPKGIICGWLWVHQLFFKEIWKNGTRDRGHMFANAKGKQQKYIYSTAIVSGTVYWLYIPYCLSGLLRTQFFWHNLSRNSCICITLYMSLMQQLYITGALKGHHLKGVYSPQDLYFPLTTLLAHPRWDLPVKCFTPMVSENKNTLKSMKSSLLGYYSSRS